MDMFKDFKYTKYDSNQIGKYETVTLKEFGGDAIMKFDQGKAFTEMECSSVNANDDNVTFVFSGVTYTAELSGMRKGNPMVEMNIKFNGTIYKNELVVLKTVNDNINKNIMIGGSKLLHRISDNAIVVEDSFILTDNTTNFEIPVEKINESVDMNIKNEDYDIKLYSLGKLMDRFYQGSQKKYNEGKWSIESLDENRDTWTLSYDGNELIECMEDYAYFTNNSLSFENACKVAGIVEIIYGHDVDLSAYKNVE